MTIGMLLVILAVVLIGAVLIWNFVPAIHNKVNGWTTILELIGSIVYTILANVTGGIQEAVQAGYVPPWLVGWVPVLMLIWFIFKRFRTKAPVGVPT